MKKIHSVYYIPPAVIARVNRLPDHATGTGGFLAAWARRVLVVLRGAK